MADDDDSFSSLLLKSKRSKFTKMVRDEINTSVNSRNNLVFEGASRPLTDSSVLARETLLCCDLFSIPMDGLLLPPS